MNWRVVAEWNGMREEALCSSYREAMRQAQQWQDEARTAYMVRLRCVRGPGHVEWQFLDALRQGRSFRIVLERV